MSRPAAGSIEPGGVWLDKDIPARRLRVLEVTDSQVVAAVTYSSAPDAFDHAARTTSIQRLYWRRRFTPEVQP